MDNDRKPFYSHTILYESKVYVARTSYISRKGIYRNSNDIVLRQVQFQKQYSTLNKAIIYDIRYFKNIISYLRKVIFGIIKSQDKINNY